MNKLTQIKNSLFTLRRKVTSEKNKHTIYEAYRHTMFNKPKAPDASSEGFVAYIEKLRSGTNINPNTSGSTTGISTVNTSASPQELQGLWQAYGQIRAAKVAGRFALLATGGVGVGLWMYQQWLKNWENELRRENLKIEQEKIVIKNTIASSEEGEEKIKTLVALIIQHENEQERAIRYAALLEQKFSVASIRAEKACGEEKKCLDEYQHELKEAEKKGKLIVDEALGAGSVTPRDLR